MRSVEPDGALTTSMRSGIWRRSSSTWETMPTVRPPACRRPSSARTAWRVSGSREPKPSFGGNAETQISGYQQITVEGKSIHTTSDIALM